MCLPRSDYSKNRLLRSYSYGISPAAALTTLRLGGKTWFPTGPGCYQRVELLRLL